MGRKHGAGGSRKAKRKLQRQKKRARRDSHNRQHRASLTVDPGASTSSGRYSSQLLRQHELPDNKGSMHNHSSKRRRLASGSSDQAVNVRDDLRASKFTSDSAVSSDSLDDDADCNVVVYPEDREIAYLEQKLFSGKKYSGEKGKRKLAKEWVEKDGFDDDFSDFLSGLEKRVFTSSAPSGEHEKINVPDVRDPLKSGRSPMRRDRDSEAVQILRPRALSVDVQSESEAEADDDDATAHGEEVTSAHKESSEDSSSSSDDQMSPDNNISSEEDEGYGLVRSRSNSISHHALEHTGSSADVWGGVKPSKTDGQPDPEDVEIEYLEKKLFSGKYKGDKGRRRLAKEWIEKDGFDADFASFINELGSVTSTSTGNGAQPESRETYHSRSSYKVENEIDDEENDSGVSQDSSSDDADEASSTSDEDESDKDEVINLYGGKGGAKPSAAEIYGQTPMGGRHDDNGKPTKYVPPHLRRNNASAPTRSKWNDNLGDDGRLQRQVNGLFNRCGEANIESIANSMAELYSQNPNSLVNRALSNAILDACCGNREVIPKHGSGGIQLLEPLVRNAAALTTAIHHIVPGSQLGANVLEGTVERLSAPLDVRRYLDDASNRNDAEGDTDVPSGKEGIETEDCLQLSLDKDKSCNNLIMLLAYLYTFGTIECILIYDFVRLFSTRLNEPDIELLLLLVTKCGSKMRSDDPNALRDIILLVQKSVARVRRSSKSSEVRSARIDFMLDTIYDLKNNKTKHRRSHTEARETTTRLLKWLLHIKKRHSSIEQALGVPLDDLMDAEVRGRWWVVGGRWVGRRRGKNQSGPTLSTEEQEKMKEDPHANIRVGDIDMDQDFSSIDDRGASGDPNGINMMALAQAKRMNTDVRRSIFLTIIGSSDYMDAFERVMKLGLREKQEREIVYVLLACCEDEPDYNPFYAHVAQKLCAGIPRFKFTFQLAFWDRFKLLAGKEGDEHLEQYLNSAKLLAHLTVHFSLSLAVLKVVDFGPNMSNIAVVYFHTFCLAIICDPLCISDDDDVGVGRMDAGRQGPRFDRIRKIFSRIGTSTDHAFVRQGLAFFLRQHIVERLSRKIKRLKQGKGNHVKRKQEWRECVLRKRRAKAALSCLDRVSLE